ncbi:MAG: metal-dependent hydrolase [Hyphomicrobiaceae bacterium]
MANYATHIGYGTVVSGGLATLTLAADILSPESLMAVTLAGVVGSFLPDIDLKDSRASGVLFSAFAFFFAFCVMFLNADKYSIIELWLLVATTFILTRYGAEAAFQRFSYHRGIWHSLAAALFFSFLTIIIYHYLLGLHPGVAWLGGGFMLVGYLTHLILDEIYSVDLMNRRLKLSFGSALKIVDTRRPGESLFVVMIAAIAFLLTPPSTDFIRGITSADLWRDINARLLPKEAYFGVIPIDASKRGAPSESGAAIDTAADRVIAPATTGSLPAAR